MNPMNKSERIRLSYVKRARELLMKSFGLTREQVQHHNVIWTDQTTNIRPGWEHLLDILRDPRPSSAYKARVISILLAPNATFFPFSYPVGCRKRKDEQYRSALDKIGLATLPKDLLNYTCEHLALCVQTASSFTEKKNDDVRHSLSYYNRLIIEALGVLAEHDSLAAKLFALWEPLDPVPYYGEEEHSAYYSFLNILSADIPERWKQKANDMMRTRVVSEREGTFTPGKPYERADNAYMYYLNLLMYDSHFPYSKYLFAQQVEFIVSLSGTPTLTFSSDCVWRVLDLLSGDEYINLRRRFAAHTVLKDHGKYHNFTIWSDLSEKAACSMIRDITHHNMKVLQRLGELQEERKAAIAKQGREQANKEQHKTQLYAATH